MTPETRSVLVIHGGAGTLAPEAMTPERADAFHDGLRRALGAGHAVLKAGGTALDAVTAAVTALEDDTLFNAGRGAVFTADGEIEMDAAVMEGRQRRAGAVAGICGPRHPVLAARAVMEHSDHVFLAGKGAHRFCRQAGLEHQPPSWFHTEARWKALQQELERRRLGLADDGDEARRHGTVGAVACDGRGDLAAATSTGGLTAKLPGRVGDTPVLGAGTWADNAACAVSATGHGEMFIRCAAGHEVASRMRWGGQGLEEAATAVVMEDLAAIGGSGGLIAVDARGRVAMPFNCAGMYRGFVGEDGSLHTAIYREAFRVEPV